MAYDFTGTKVKYDNGVSDAILPRNIRYGACYELHKLLFFERPLVALDIDDRIHLGTELWLPSLLNIQLGLRGGLQRDIYPYGEKKITSSFGTSIKYQGFVRINHASERDDIMGGAAIQFIVENPIAYVHCRGSLVQQLDPFIFVISVSVIIPVRVWVSKKFVDHHSKRQIAVCIHMMTACGCLSCII